MNARHEQVKRLLAAALEKQVPERGPFLDEACAGDSKLRTEVESLLSSYEAGAFLETPATPQVGVKPGDMVGRYKLLKQIGEGGFGLVFMAEQQEPIRRRGALKIIKEGMDTREVIGRFEAERQALALMEHPNIARVLDAGATSNGRPYFVMELVNGIPITEYCDTACLSTEQRLHLFLEVCRAVEHAHQKGIIHRDLKPTNILVTVIDGRPVPKVIDFGVAKALGQRLTEKTVFTSFRQMIGTPAYMSPEQAELRGVDVDSRSDIYSLGVLLYELLTGVAPFDEQAFRKAAFDQIRRMIRETEPQKPSIRVRNLGPRLKNVAIRHHADPAAFPCLMAGDLDWIVMKALEKDPARRYDTATALGEDLQRHLRNEPVQAGPPSRMYRARKFIRRTAATMVGFVRADQEGERVLAAEQRAESEARIAAAVNAFLTEDLLEKASPEKEPERDIKLRTIVDRAAEKIDRRFSDQPLVEAAIRETLGTVYLQLGENAKARSLFTGAAELYRRACGPTDPKTLRVRRSIGVASREQGQISAARELLKELHSEQDSVLGPQHQDTLCTSHALAATLVASGRSKEACAVAEQTLDSRRSLLGPDHPETIETMGLLANILADLGLYQEAQGLQEQVVALQTRIEGLEHPKTLASSAYLAVIFEERGMYEEARKLHERVTGVATRVLGKEHPATLKFLDNSAHGLNERGNTKAAIELEKEILEVRTRVLGPEHPDTLKSRFNLARFLERDANVRESCRINEEVLAASRRVLGPEHPDTLGVMINLAAVLKQQLRIDEARKLSNEALDIALRVLGPEHPITLSAMKDQAVYLHHQGKSAEAQEIVERVISVQTRALGLECPQTLRTLVVLAQTIACQEGGDVQKAQQVYEHVLAVRKRILGDEHPATLGSVGNLAWSLLQQGRYKEARAMIEELLPSMARLAGPKHRFTLIQRGNLARCIALQGNYVVGRKLLEGCLAEHRRVLGDEDLQTFGLTGALLEIVRLGCNVQKPQSVAEALSFFEGTLPRLKKVLGTEDLLTLHATADLAFLLLQQGRLKEAQELRKEVLAVSRRVFGATHPFTGHAIYANLCSAGLYTNNGNFTEAQRILDELRPIVSERENNKDELTLDYLRISEQLCLRTGRLEDAADLARQRATALVQRSGPEGMG